MFKRNKVIKEIIQLICYLAFFGYFMKTLDLIVSYAYSLSDPASANDFYKGIDLSGLLDESKLYYTLSVLVLVIISALKSYVFYLTTRIFKMLNFVNPFSKDISGTIAKITYITFLIGLSSGAFEIITKEILETGFKMRTLETFWQYGDSYLFMAAILFVITLIFKKGIELQTENELTV